MNISEPALIVLILPLSKGDQYLIFILQKICWNVISIQCCAVQEELLHAGFLMGGIRHFDGKLLSTELLLDLKAIPVRGNGRRNVQPVEIGTEAQDTLHAAYHNGGCGWPCLR